MNNRQDFISWAYDPVVNQQRIQVIMDMVSFISEGLRDIGGGPPRLPDGFYAFENEVKAALFERQQVLTGRPIPKRMLQPHGDTLQLVAECFLENHRWVTRDAPIAGFRAGHITEDLQQRLNAFWHPEVEEEEPTVATAFEVTYSNLARVNTRLTLTTVIRELAKLRHDDTASKVRYELYIRRSELQRDLMVFGALHGGELLKTALRQVAPQMCYAPDDDLQYALMTYVSRDSVSPGIWSSDAEKNLRLDIKARYEAL